MQQQNSVRAQYRRVIRVEALALKTQITCKCPFLFPWYAPKIHQRQEIAVVNDERTAGASTWDWRKSSWFSCSCGTRLRHFLFHDGSSIILFTCQRHPMARCCCRKLRCSQDKRSSSWSEICRLLWEQESAKDTCRYSPREEHQSNESKKARDDDDLFICGRQKAVIITEENANGAATIERHRGLSLP